MPTNTATNPFTHMRCVVIDSITPTILYQREKYTSNLFNFVANLKSTEPNVLTIFFILYNNNPMRTIFFVDGISDRQLYSYPIFLNLVNLVSNPLFGGGMDNKEKKQDFERLIVDKMKSLVLSLIQKWKDEPSLLSNELHSTHSYRFYQNNEHQTKYSLIFLSGNQKLIQSFAYYNQTDTNSILYEFVNDLYTKLCKDTEIIWGNLNILFDHQQQGKDEQSLLFRRTLIQMPLKYRSAACYPSNHTAQELHDFIHNLELAKEIIFERFKTEPILFIYLKMCLMAKQIPQLQEALNTGETKLFKSLMNTKEPFRIQTMMETIHVFCINCKMKIKDISSLLFHLAVCYFLLDNCPSFQAVGLNKFRTFSDILKFLDLMTIREQCFDKIKNLRFFQLISLEFKNFLEK